jgi:hypothetical protein
MANKDYENAKAKKNKRKEIELKDIKIDKKTQKYAKKLIKNSPFLVLMAVMFLIVGAVCGFFGVKIATKNDCFNMVSYENNNIDITIGPEEVYQDYIEKGVKCISFGKDISSSCIITYSYREDISHDVISVESIDKTKSGIYYATYKINNLEFGSITLIRNIIVMEVEKNG